MCFKLFQECIIFIFFLIMRPYIILECVKYSVNFKESKYHSRKVKKYAYYAIYIDRIHYNNKSVFTYVRFPV